MSQVKSGRTLKVRPPVEESPLTATLPSDSPGQGLALRYCCSDPVKADLWSHLARSGLLMASTWPHLPWMLEPNFQFEGKLGKH